MRAPNIRRFDRISAPVPNNSQRVAICQARTILIEFIGVTGDNLWNTQIFRRSLKPLSRFSVFVTLLWKGVRQGDRLQLDEHFFSVRAKY